MDRWHLGQASLPMTIREECFPGTAFAGCTGYPFPTLSFRAQREIFFVPFFPPPSLSRLRETPPPPFLQYGVSRFSLPNTRPLAANKKDPSLSMTIRGISPYHAQKSPSQSWSFFCVRKTYLPNCASMVPAATAVPITPATFGPIACISR